MVLADLIQTVLRFLCIALVVIFLGAQKSVPVYALNESVVISRIQVAGAATGTSAEEYVSLYNNTSQDINVTGWCLTSNLSKISCFTTLDTRTELYISAYSSILVMNPTLEAIIKSTQPTFRADALFTSSASALAATNGSLQIIDKQTQIIDTVGWGTGVANTKAVTGNIPAGKVIKRISQNANILKDTKNNNLDFEITSMDGVYPGGGMYEYVQSDLCLNTAEIDSVIPPGFMQDDSGNCFKDLCMNIPGLQTLVPRGYTAQGGDCVLVQISITELLPNPAGTDTGKEFVELYNPNAYSTNLGGYSIQLSTSTKKYIFPESIEIDSGGYTFFSDSQLGFSLPNTSSVVRLYAPDGSLVHETVSYSSPKEDMAWALLNNGWQYTSVLTPGAPNELPSVAIDGSGSDIYEQDECPAGKYRNPATNRCKNIEVSTSSLTPCASDQERNPATNRCRKIVTASATLVPCKEGQERNLATNRCKKIDSSASTLKSCESGQERNPATNRCRKVKANTAGTGLDASSKAALINSFKYKVPLIGLLSTAFIGYGAYEYRQDLQNYIRKIRASRRRGRPPG